MVFGVHISIKCPHVLVKYIGINCIVLCEDFEECHLCLS